MKASCAREWGARFAATVVKLAEANYQGTMTWVRNSQAHSDEMRNEVETIQKDHAAMKVLERETNGLFTGQPSY